MILNCHPTPRDHDSNNFNLLEFTLLHYSWGFFHSSYSFFGQINFEEIFSIYPPPPHIVAPHFSHDSNTCNGSRIVKIIFEKKIFDKCEQIFNNFKLSPLVRGFGPSVYQTWISFTQGCFGSSLAESSPVVLEEKKYRKCTKFTDGQTDGNWTDKRWL